MEAVIVSYIINGALGLAMYFMKLNHDTTKERLSSQEQALIKLRDDTLRKEDFREFKQELRMWLDEMKADVREALGKRQ